MVKFFIGGHRVDPNNIGDALMPPALESNANPIREKVGAIREQNTCPSYLFCPPQKPLNSRPMSVGESNA